MLLGVGLGSAVLAFLWDVLRGLPLSFGLFQSLLLLGGVVACLAGIALVVPSGRRYVTGLLEASLARTPAVHAATRERPYVYALYGAWIGMVFGLAEVAIWLTRNVFLEVLLFKGLDFAWMVPALYALFFGVIGLGIAALAWKWPKRITLRVGVGPFLFLGFAAVLLTVPGLHQVAVVILAAGLAVQGTRLLTKHAYLFHRLVRRTFAGLAVLLLVVAGGLYGGRQANEHRALARLATPASEAPNILFIVLDTVRAKSLSLYGYARETSPQLERFARHGVVFEHAFSTSPWTLPSHSSMFTGRLPYEMSAGFRQPLDDTHPTLAEALRSHGYETGGFVANTTYCAREFGLARGFTHYEDFRVSLGQALLYSSLGRTITNRLKLVDKLGNHENFGRKSAERVNRDFLQWLDGRDGTKPYFAFLNYYDAHGNYLPPKEFALKFSPQRPRGDIYTKELDEWTPAEVQELNDAYDGAIAYLDHHLGQLFNSLERRGTLERTLVVITADHGEHFGEHQILEHSNSLYQPLLRVPLVLSFPGYVPAQERIPESVSLRNLPATVINLVGLSASNSFPGHSLATYWQAPPVHRPTESILAEAKRVEPAYPEWYPARKGYMQALIHGTYHYIRNHGDGTEELFDFGRDPEEEHNLIATEEGREVADRLSTQLDVLFSPPETGVSARKFGDNSRRETRR